MNTPRATTSHSVFEGIQELRQKYSDKMETLHQANEAQTRLIIIDKVLKLLGWEEEEFGVETYIGVSGYTDYLLSIDNNPLIIVEAKRTGHTFGLSRKGFQQTEYALSYLYSAFPGSGIRDVIDQARGYSLETGVPYAVITNGMDWLFMQVGHVVGGRNPDDLKAFYFGNLFGDSFAFDLFWSLLNRSSVNEGYYVEKFNELLTEPATYSLVPRNKHGDFIWVTGDKANEIRDFYSLFFDQMLDPARREMLKHCFVFDSELEHHEGRLKRALRDTLPSYMPPGTQDITPDEHEVILSTSSGDRAGKVIIVAGSVGCGKSTFVHRVIQQAEENDARKKKDLFVKIDLINQVTSQHVDVSSLLWQMLFKQWKDIDPEDTFGYENLVKIFQAELARLRQGSYKRLYEQKNERYLEAEAELLEQLCRSPEEYLPRCWRYYLQHHKRVIVFIDNVDRADQDFQKQVYAFSHELAESTGATIIITMREVTFFRGKENGFLDVRSDQEVFHLKAPDRQRVLSQRIKYVQNSLELDPRARAWKRSRDWEEWKEHVYWYGETLKDTFLKDKEGSNLLSIIEAISWNNIRLFLEVLKHLHIHFGASVERWRFEEVIASLMIIPYYAGNPNRIIVNVYEPPFARYPCYFLKIRLLLLLMYGIETHEIHRGLPYTRLASFGRKSGYRTSWIDRAIVELVQARLIESVNAPAELDYVSSYELNREHDFRRTAFAEVLLDKPALCTSSIYLALIGNSLTFQSQKQHDNYVNEYSYTISGINNQLSRDNIDVLSGATDLSKIVAGYLVKRFEKERAPINLQQNDTEISIVETMLSRIITRLQELGFVQVSNQFHFSHGVQPTLPQMGDFDRDLATEKTISEVPIPDGILDMKLGKSKYAPLIFWALVAIQSTGEEYARGTAITKVINNYLMPIGQQVEATNVSRALRGRVLQEDMKWLETIQIDGNIKLFSLSADWPEHWKLIFGSAPPDID